MPTKASFTVASCRKHVQLLAYWPSCRCIDTGGIHNLLVSVRRAPCRYLRCRDMYVSPPRHRPTWPSLEPSLPRRARLVPAPAARPDRILVPHEQE